MTFASRIKKLNVLEKLLQQDLVSIRMSLGDEAVVREVNEEVKKFLLAHMESIFSGVPSAGTAQFTSQEMAVLKEFVRKMTARVTSSDTREVAPETPENGIYTPPPKGVSSVRQKGSPVLDALKAQGFNPGASMEERKAAIKAAEKKK